MKMKFAVISLFLCATAPAFGQTPDAGAATMAIKASELPNPPVIPGDILDRPYTVLGQITAGVRKATVFSKPSSPEKIYRELWERGKKLGADAVVHASFGKSEISVMSWGQTNATGVAIKFTDPVTSGQNK
jgi:hypothetical protein